MGIDFLDLTFRLEKAFDLKLPHEWLYEIADLARRDVQAACIHDYICKLLENYGRPIAPSTWHRVKLCISQVVGENPWKIRRESWLVKQLGFA